MQFSEFIVLQSPTRPLAQTTVQEVPSARSEAPSSGATAQDAALLLIPLCFIAIWAAVVCMISDTWKLNRKEMNQAKQLGQLPCKKCRFFNNNPYIKCAVNPNLALTKESQDCPDYRPRDRRLPQSGRKKCG